MKFNKTERGLILVFGSEKGGAGKSTCAINVACELTKLKYKVLIVDADRQRTSSKWADRRNQEITENNSSWSFVHCVEKLGKIKQIILEMSQHYDVVIVDPSGRDSAELRSALMIADYLYIPTQASQFDLETMDDISNLFQEVTDYNENLQAYTIITQAPTHFGAKELLEAKNYLKEFNSIFPLCKSIIKSRKAYRVAPRTGAGVVEYIDEIAKTEIKHLTQEIIENASK